MPPTGVRRQTRSQTALALSEPSSSNIILDVLHSDVEDGISPVEDDADIGPINDSNLKESFAAVARAVSGLRRQVLNLEKTNRGLRERNGTMASQLREYQESRPRRASLMTRQQHSRSTENAITSRNEVAALNRRLRACNHENDRLKRDVAKYKNAVRQLERNEIDKEVDELSNENVHDVEDSDAEHGMRKLLRELSDLVSVTGVLADEGEDCCICMEGLGIGNSSSFPCQHIVCDECIEKLPNKGLQMDQISCPNCRGECSRDDLEKVQYTATSQWDRILDIAKSFSKMDRHHGDVDTSEEEHEEQLKENFINDDGTESQGAGSDEASDRVGSIDDNPSGNENETNRADDSDDEPLGTPSYTQASSSVKARRLAKLAKERRNRKYR